jgi:hypothetical protein
MHIFLSELCIIIFLNLGGENKNSNNQMDWRSGKTRWLEYGSYSVRISSVTQAILSYVTVTFFSHSCQMSG